MSHLRWDGIYFSTAVGYAARERQNGTGDVAVGASALEGDSSVNVSDHTAQYTAVDMKRVRK